MGALKDAFGELNEEVGQTRQLIQTADQEVTAFFSRAASQVARVSSGGAGGGNGIVVGGRSDRRESDYFLIDRFIQQIRQGDGFRLQGFGVQASVTDGSSTKIRSGSG